MTTAIAAAALTACGGHDSPAMSLDDKAELMVAAVSSVDVTEREAAELITVTRDYHCERLSPETAAQDTDWVLHMAAYGESYGWSGEQTGEAAYLAAVMACEW